MFVMPTVYRFSSSLAAAHGLVVVVVPLVQAAKPVPYTMPGTQMYDVQTWSSHSLSQSSSMVGVAVDELALMLQVSRVVNVPMTA